MGEDDKDKATAEATSGNKEMAEVFPDDDLEDLATMTPIHQRYEHQNIKMNPRINKIQRPRPILNFIHTQITTSFLISFTVCIFKISDMYFGITAVEEARAAHHKQIMKKA